MRRRKQSSCVEAVVEGLEGKANYNNDNIIDIKELDLFITNLEAASKNLLTVSSIVKQ